MMASAIVLGASALTTQAVAKSNCPVEKCYGIAKKMKNECGTPRHACAAQAKTNNDRADWIFVMKGNCKMITGGHLHPPKSSAPAKS